MPPKASKEAKEKAVKGDEAEELILQYMKQANRPYGAADVSANLKGKVTKPICQKLLTTMGEKGTLTMKMYGKQSLFVYPQESLETLSSTELVDLDTEIKDIASELEEAKKQLKTLTGELAKMNAQPKTEDLEKEITKIEEENKINLEHLIPLRASAGASPDDSMMVDGSTSGSGGGGGGKNGSGSGPMSKEDLDALDKEWLKWRKEWVSRKKVYLCMLDIVAPEMKKSDHAAFEEDEGIEPDTEECIALEASELCTLKRKRA